MRTAAVETCSCWRVGLRCHPAAYTFPHAEERLCDGCMTPADYPAEEEAEGGGSGSKSEACITCGDPGAVRRRKSGVQGWWGEQLRGGKRAMLGGTGEQQAAVWAPAYIHEKMRPTSTADLSKRQPAPTAIASHSACLLMSPSSAHSVRRPDRMRAVLPLPLLSRRRLPRGGVGAAQEEGRQQAGEVGSL